MADNEDRADLQEEVDEKVEATEDVAEAVVDDAEVKAAEEETEEKVEEEAADTEEKAEEEDAEVDEKAEEDAEEAPEEDAEEVPDEKADSEEPETKDEPEVEAKTVIPIEVEEEVKEAEATEEEVKEADEDPEEKTMMVDVDDQEDEAEKSGHMMDEDEEKGGMVSVSLPRDPRERRAVLLRMVAATNREMGGEESARPMSEEEMRRKRRDDFLRRMGMKTEEIAKLSDDAIYCAIEGKALETSEPCAFCRGGCVKEDQLPSLLDVAMAAEAELKGEVFDLGYSAQDDLFVLDLKRADGTSIETFYTGEGKHAGWYLLNQELVDAAGVEGKDAWAAPKVISIEQAEKVALESVEGKSMGAVPAMFEGFDAYAIEVDGVDGKSYDVYVGLEGEVLGYDSYDDNPTDEEIKALEAEIELKREFTSERREELAEEGKAMPDGSFPIVTADDLKNAIQAVGRAKDIAAARAHIKKRAKALDREDLLPDSWKGTKSDDAEPRDDSMQAALMEFELLREQLDNEL